MPTTLQKIISQGENSQVEFKEHFNKQVLETIVAFANTKGGSILIGLSDNKNIKGIQVNTETIQNWTNQIKLSTRGGLYEVVEQTMKFIIGHLKVAFEFTGEIKRTEIFGYPLAAIQELVLNAIIHRDYTSPTDIQGLFIKK